MQSELVKRYWVYHKKQCVDGKIVYEKEYKTLLGQGWVTTPNDFFKKKEKGEDPIVVARGTEPEGEVVIPPFPPEE